MKFLIALSVLASSTVFAQGMERGWKIKCYEPAQQGGSGDLVYVLKGNPRSPVLHVVHPFHQPLKLNELTQCLEHPGNGPAETMQPDRLTLCPGEGQQMNGLVPIEATYGDEESDIYCEKKINHWLEPEADLF